MNLQRPGAPDFDLSLFELHPNAILVIDQRGTVVDANAAAAWLSLDGKFPDFSEITGLSASERPRDDGIPAASWTRRMRARAADGTSRNVEATLIPAGRASHFYLDLRDLTNSTRAARSHQESISRSTVSGESAPVLTWMADQDNLREWFNKTWLSFRGEVLVDEFGDGWTRGIHPEDREQRLAICTSLTAQRQPFTLDYRLMRHDGTYRWMLEAAIPRFAEDGKFLGYIGSCVDITARKQQEEQLSEHTRTLRLTDARREDFLTRLSHELRNPLDPIANAAVILQSLEHLDPTLVTVREIVARQVDHLRRIVTDLVDVTRITRGKVVLERSVVGVDTVIDAAIELAAPNVEKQRRIVRERGSVDSNVRLSADLQRLSQALAALLDNAIKFSPDGSPVRISVEPSEGAVAIVVRDTGRGIGAELLPHVFELFVQGEQTLAREDGGLGVGLTIARRIAELHAGTVEVTSTGLASGTVATLRVPSQPTSTVGEPFDIGVVRGRVLIVDDKGDELETLRMRVALTASEVRTAASASEALVVAESFTPDVVLCDIGLPDVDGYELIDLLRKKFEGAPVRCIALTGYGRIEDRDLALRSGFDAFWLKPWLPGFGTGPVEDNARA